ncbi:MAG TPA: hypothetical protein VMH04_11500 [Candidatus Solibacter sp.]|nr:hypothetical protein [Candidatus Solibacter sp.]
MKRANLLTALFCLCFVTVMWAQPDHPGVVPTRTVTGTRIGHYKDGAVPVDLSIRTIAALVPGATGGYNVITGTGTTSGTFSISNVPFGYYLLQLGGRYLWTKNTVVNADYDSGVRSTEVLAGENTTLTFNLRHLNPWQSNDLLEFINTSTGAFQLYTGTDGATTFTGTYPYTNYLSDASQGDMTYLLQLATQEVGGYPFDSIARFFQIPLTQVDGVDTTIGAWLPTVSQARAFRANIAGADLAAQALAANPGATLTSTVVALDVYPGSLAKGFIVATPDLVGYDFNNDVTPLTVNADLGDVMYGNPFPRSFELFVIYSYQAQTNYLLPGTTQSGPISTSAYGYTPAIPTATTPIAPMIGTISNPAVNGGDFFADRSGIGFSPTLTWVPPQVGRANLYIVRVYDLISNAGVTVPTLVAILQTQGTSIRIPANLMLAGQTYVFQITPEYRPSVNVAVNPYKFGPTRAFADVLSGMMQP